MVTKENFILEGDIIMKIEARHNTVKPAYAIGAAALVATALLAGCSDTPKETTVVYAGDIAPVIDDVTDPTTDETTAEMTTVETSAEMTRSDIGENYFKEPSSDDVVTYNGIYYVKNQLLVSCELGTSKEEMESVCRDVGAEIVGYIELTSDFQIEFPQDQTPEDLDEVSEYMYSHYPFISFISLNTVYELDYDIAVEEG